MFNPLKYLNIILFIVMFNSFSQTKETSYYFKAIDVESGLSNNFVIDIHQDTKGYVWIATNNGLNRYDGYSFKIFYNDHTDTTSIASNKVNNILEDNNGNLWFATNNELNLYNKNTETFKRYNIQSDTSSSETNIHKTIFDKKRNNVWFKTNSSIGYFNIQKETFHFIKQNYQCRDITLGNAKLWILSTDGNISYLDINTLKFNNVSKALNASFIHYGKYSNKLWFSAPSKTNFDIVNFNLIPELPNKITPKVLLEKDANTLLIGNETKFYEYKVDSGKINRIQFNDEESALENQIKNIHQGIHGSLWIGTAGGIFHHDNYRKKFNHINLNKTSKDVVMAMGKTSKGIYINTLGAALYFKPKKSNTYQEIEFPPSTKIGQKYIWDIEEVPENDHSVWMATSKGLHAYNPENKTFKRILKSPSDIDLDSYTILNTPEDYVWFADKKKIYKLSKNKGNILFSYDLEKFTNRTNLIIQKMVAIKNNIFIATIGAGLLVLDTDTNSISRIRHVNDNRKDLKQIWDLYVDKEKIWIGADEGLYELDTKTMLMQPILDNNQVIFSIIKDKNDVLWMGTIKGLISFDTRINNVSHYGVESGLTNIEFNRKSVLKINDSELWFGGINGITTFNPNEIKKNTLKPPVYITKLDVITSDSTYSISPNQKNIELPWQHNNFELEYVALNYTNPSKNQYKYQLKGYDPNWVTNNTSRKVRYVQLSPGDYTFHVKASNDDDIWNDIGQQISIKIKPPFWKTWWFNNIIILSVIVLIWLGHRYRIKKVLELERMKLRIANDLHDDIGSGLSGIALTSDVIEQQINNGQLNPKLVSRITNKARYLAANLDDIVWLINPEKETLNDLILRSRTIATESLQNIQLTFEDEVNQTYKQRVINVNLKRNLTLFIKEIINNINKHAQADHVLISFKTNKQRLILRIIDDGIGFRTNINTQGNGLSSIKNRADSIKAQLTINSKLNEGTEIILNVRIP